MAKSVDNTGSNLPQEPSSDGNSFEVPDQIVGGTIQRLTGSTQAQIDLLMQPIINEINATLQRLAGRTFDAETAAAEIRQLKMLVARAGCQLHDESGLTVGIQPVPSARAKNATILVWTMIGGKRKSLRCKTAFPRLSVRPISE